MSNDARVDPLALVLVVLLFVEHLLFGANRQDLGLLFAGVHLAFLAALIGVSRGEAPPVLPDRAPVLLIGLVFALGVFSILPLGPPLAHPFWAYAAKILPGAPATISLDPVGTRAQLVKLAGLCALFLVGATVGARREGADRAARYVTVAGVLYCLWAMVAFVLDPRTIFGVARSYGVDRLGGSFFSVNTAGTLFACLAVMAVMGLLRPFLRERPSGERVGRAELAVLWPQLLLALVALACLFLSASRGALLALVAALLFCFGLSAWLKSGRRSLTGGFAAAACLILAAALALFVLGGEHAASRLADTNPLTEDRVKLFTAYWPAIKASPWLGYGLGAFSAVNAMQMNAGNARALAVVGAAHDVYLQWLLQMGVPGALAMFGAVGLVLLATVRGLRRRAQQQWLGVACLGVVVVFAVHGLVDYALEVPSMAAFFTAVLGLGYGLAERPSARRR